MSVPAGRVLGGSSSTNYMLYVRGHRHDYDKWALQGCEGWSYKEVLPYFLKSERMEDIQHVDTGEHNSHFTSLSLFLSLSLSLSLSLMFTARKTITDVGTNKERRF